MFSQTVEYALRAVVCLATDPERVQGASEISDTMDVPAGYLVKVLQQLVRSDIVVSKRGKGGGFLLKREAKKISLLDVINAVDPIKRIKTCPLELPSHCKKLCPLHSKLDASYAEMEKTFKNSFVADMVDKKK
jgi:Rrf2 family protein